MKFREDSIDQPIMITDNMRDGKSRSSGAESTRVHDRPVAEESRNYWQLKKFYKKKFPVFQTKLGLFLISSVNMIILVIRKIDNIYFLNKWNNIKFGKLFLLIQLF